MALMEKKSSTLIDTSKMTILEKKKTGTIMEQMKLQTFMKVFIAGGNCCYYSEKNWCYFKCVCRVYIVIESAVFFYLPLIQLLNICYIIYNWLQV